MAPNADIAEKDHLWMGTIYSTFGLSEHEMNNPLALCELAARASNISAGHSVKEVWLPDDRVFILTSRSYQL